MEIENGFLVQIPGIQTKTEGVISEPRSIYCSDSSEVVKVAKQWLDFQPTGGNDSGIKIHRPN